MELQEAHPCNWNDMDTCTECRKLRCPNCSKGAVCETCDIHAPRTCFAFCEIDEKVCQQKQIDFSLWQETYAAVRCLRDRRASYTISEDHIKKYFPGFCKDHNENAYRNFTKNYWHTLPWKYQKFINYVIDGGLCAIQQLDKFFLENKDIYAQTTYQDIVRLLFTPAGIMAVDPIYFQTMLTILVEKIKEERSISIPDLRRQLLEEEKIDMQAWIQRVHEEMDRLELSYGFLVEYILQDMTLQWLMDENACVRTLNWNMLFHKLFSSTMYCFIPVEAKNTIPYFRSDWLDSWNEKARLVATQTIPENIRSIFEYHWNDFIVNVSAMVETINETRTNIQISDTRPVMNVYPELLATAANCELI
jgi:hypothetical protein